MWRDSNPCEQHSIIWFEHWASDYFHVSSIYRNPIIWALLLVVELTSGLYYKPMTIVNDDSRVVHKLEASLSDDARDVIYDHHMFIIQATARTFSISAIWIFESHLENVLALRAFWRVDKANGWSHCPRQVSSVLPSPIAMAEALWMHSLQYRWPLELKREQNNQWGEISCRFCRQVEALLPERFYNFQQQLKLEKKYLESSEF